MKTARHRRLMAHVIGVPVLTLTQCHDLISGRVVMDRAHRSAKLQLRHEARQEADEYLVELAEERRIQAARAAVAADIEAWWNGQPIEHRDRDYAAWRIKHVARKVGLPDAERREVIAAVVGPKCGTCRSYGCPATTPEECWMDMEDDLDYQAYKAMEWASGLS